MITRAACETLARYNRWMNEKLYAVSAELPDAVRKEDRGAPFRFVHLPQIEKMPDMRVTHLSGRKESRLRSLAERFDVPHWTADHRALLAEDRLEGIIVALPHPLHVPVGLEVLAAGKHLLMQKPLCGDMGEADQFVAGDLQPDGDVQRV